MLDRHGYHPWAEYSWQQPLTTPSLLKPHLTDPTASVLIDHVTTFLINLGLRWIFQNPEDGSMEVLYGQDMELRWTETTTGAKTGHVPPRYVHCNTGDGVIHEPMNQEWFLNMVSQFQVLPHGKLLKDGLEVCFNPTDFEWKAVVRLELELGELDLALYTP